MRSLPTRTSISHVLLCVQVNEPATTMGSPGELLSRRCVGLLKNALRPDVWPNSDLKLVCLDKILRTVDSPQPNIANICMALELLGFLLQFLVSVCEGEGRAKGMKPWDVIVTDMLKALS